MAKIIRVNTKSRSITIEELPPALALLGGRELTSTIIADEVKPKADPLGPENKLVLATGLLAATPAPNFSRLSAGCKSPLTGGIKEANVGGKAGFALGMHDIRAIVLENSHTDDAFYYLIIKSDSSVTWEPAREPKTTGNYALCEELGQRFGSTASVISIGTAGANLMLMASIAVQDLQNHPTRHAARGGPGAVMGSKGIKAIVIEPKKGAAVSYADAPAFKSIAAPWAKDLKTTRVGFSKLGTAMTVGISQMLQGLPTKNFREGTFAGAEKIGGDHLHELIVERKGRFGIPCMPGCAIQCSNLVIGPDGMHATSSLEYETIAMNGSNLLIDDIDTIARIDHECDDIGIDTIEFGNMMGVLMEAGKYEFGDAKGVFEVLGEIRDCTAKGKFYGKGVHRVGTELGVDRLPTVKKQGMSAYDPRTYKGMGATFCTTPMGADHTAGAAIYKRPGFDAKKDYGDVFDSKGKLDLSFELQVLIGACDMLGICYFVGPSFTTLERAAKLINARYGTSISQDDLLRKVKEMLKKELDFNVKAGFTKRDDSLPAFFKTERLPETGRTWDIPDDELARFWDARLNG
nr:aldehyde ferredoxin oxidoreductase C-terminal domain-containing protein [Candidatus Sigynarchaeum springense]